MQVSKIGMLLIWGKKQPIVVIITSIRIIYNHKQEHRRRSIPESLTRNTETEKTKKVINAH